MRNMPDAPPTKPSQGDTEYSAAAERAFSDQPPDAALEPLSHIFLAEFQKAEQDRNQTEIRWLQDLRQYKGKYDPDEEAAIGPVRSKSFVRKSRVKVKTVDSRVSDILFPAGSDKNWDVSPTPVPTVSDEERAEVVQRLTEAAQQKSAPQQDNLQAQAPGAAQPGQPGQSLPPQAPGQPSQQINAAQRQPTKEDVDAAILEVVKKSAKAMAKAIDDQLVESRYKQQALQVLHSGHLYGTGILKGPLVERKIRTKFNKTGNDWKPTQETYLVPFVDYVPLWRFYPDMNATTLEQCNFIYERHTFTPAQLFALTKNKSFSKVKIDEHMAANPEGLCNIRYFDADLKSIGDRDTKQGDSKGQYEVLERWGYIEGPKLASVGIPVPKGREQESFFSNVWMLPNGTIIKAVLQPINGITWPYHIYYFDKDETSIFGEGLCAIMRDDQKMLNAATRMMLDNGAITSGPMVEISTGLLASMDDATALAPWKVYLRNASTPGQPAVRVIELPNNIEWLTMMAKMFDNNADEVTAIPRYMSGENVNSGAAGTASGMSMLMGAVNIVIKDLISGYDEGITIPFLKALYHWNMQFNPDPLIKGDFDVHARGTASLVAKEVRARQINEFAQLVIGPLDAPFINRLKLNQQRAEALELSDIIKTEEEIEADAKDPVIQKQKQMQEEMQAALLSEQQAKAGKLVAEAEVAKAKVGELVKKLELMAAEMLKTQAETEKAQAETISKKVEAVFAALQAGGVATTTPNIAPAGDEILRSSGWVDATPEPSIAGLYVPPVQGDTNPNLPTGTVTPPLIEPQDPGFGGPDGSVTENGQPLAAGGQDAGDVQPDIAAPLDPTPPMNPTDPSLDPQTGMVGRRAGMTTARIEP